MLQSISSRARCAILTRKIRKMVPFGFAVDFFFSTLVYGIIHENFLSLCRFFPAGQIYPILMWVDAVSSEENAYPMPSERFLYDRNDEYYDKVGVYPDYDRQPTFRIFPEMLEHEEDKRTLSAVRREKYHQRNDDDDDAVVPAFRDSLANNSSAKNRSDVSNETKNNGTPTEMTNSAKADEEIPQTRILPDVTSNSHVSEDSSGLTVKSPETNDASIGSDTSGRRNNTSPEAAPPRYIAFFNDPFLWRMPEVPSRKKLQSVDGVTGSQLTDLGEKPKPQEVRNKSPANDPQIVKIKSKALPGGPTIYGERSDRRKFANTRKYKGIDRKPNRSLARVATRPIQSSAKSSARSPLKSTRKSTFRRNVSELHKTEPEMLSLKYDTVIHSRYARTTVCGCLRNYGDTQTININMIMPRAALITRFETNVGGRTTSADVRESNVSEDLRKVQVMGEDIGTFLVEARDCEAIVVPVLVPKECALNYSLTYEYLLPRELAVYSAPVILHSNRWIKDLTVKWRIFEERNITQLHVPQIYRTTALPAIETEDEIYCIDEEGEGIVNVIWKPTMSEQQNMSYHLGPLSKDGLVGVMLLQYDVDHNQDPCGQVVKDGNYFAQFFAAPDQPPLAKHVVFILDCSDSMQGEPIKHLKKAMVNILDTLQSADKFTLIDFSDEVEVINIQNRSMSVLYRSVPKGPAGRGKYSGKTPWPGALWTYEATPANILAAKKIVMNMQLRYYTNIYDALIMGYKAIADVSAFPPAETGQPHPEPIIVFLTDGQPSDGPTYDDDVILKMVEDQNSHTKATIVALGFGPNADMSLLRRFALATNGIEKHIYNDNDAADQLISFFESIKAPIFKNIYFKYNSKQVDTSTLTQQWLPIIYTGKEVVVAGKLNDDDVDEADLYTDITGLGRYAIIRCERTAARSRKSDGSSRTVVYYSNYTALRSLLYTDLQNPSNIAQRIWAYLMLHQLRDAAETDQVTARQETECDDQLKPDYRMLEICLRLNYAMPTITNLVYDDAVVEQIPVSPELDESSLTDESQPQLDPLNQFTWLLKMRDKHGFAKLPISSRRTGRLYTYLSLGVGQHPHPRKLCPDGPDGAPGVCRYLPECPDPRILGTPENFRKHFCRLGSYAGVCCSHSFLQQNVTIPEA